MRSTPSEQPTPEYPAAERGPVRRVSILVASLLALTLVAAACGSTDSDAVASLEESEVATLEDAALAAVRTDEDASETNPEDAALAFSQCMRDEGVDFPDLAVDAEGNIDLRAGFENIDRNDETFQEARTECQSELAAGGFGGGRRQALTSTEVQDGLVAYTDCIRDEGFDVGDLTLGQGPGGTGNGDGTANGTANDAANDAANADAAGGAEAADGDGGGPQAGRRQGGFGDPNNRLAEQLGLDPEDPETAAALELCEPVLEEAFAAAGLGQAAGPGAGENNG